MSESPGFRTAPPSPPTMVIAPCQVQPPLRSDSLWHWEAIASQDGSHLEFAAAEESAVGTPAAGRFVSGAHTRMLRASDDQARNDGRHRTHRGPR